MARSRSKPAAAKRSAPPPAAKPAAQQQQKTAPPPPQQPAAAAPSAGPGLMGMMGSTMAGAVVGNVVGHGISNMLFGRSGAPVTDPQEMQQVQQAYGQGACQNNLQMYTKCMEANSNDSEVCNFAWKEFAKCAESEQPPSA